MPEVVSSCAGAFDRIVDQAISVDEEPDADDMAEDPAPRTPKRCAEAAGASVSTPVKQARQEPTNADIMQVLQAMQKQQAEALQGSSSRLQNTESKILDLKAQTSKKFATLEAQVSEVTKDT